MLICKPAHAAADAANGLVDLQGPLVSVCSKRCRPPCTPPACVRVHGDRSSTRTEAVASTHENPGSTTLAVDQPLDLAGQRVRSLPLIPSAPAISPPPTVSVEKEGLLGLQQRRVRPEPVGRPSTLWARRQQMLPMHCDNEHSAKRQETAVSEERIVEPAHWVRDKR